MRFTSTLSALALTAFTFAIELPKDEALGASLYDSGVMMDRIMAKKFSFWDKKTEMGLMDATVYPKLGFAACVDGYAIPIPGDPLYKFRCKNTDLYSFVNHADLGAPSGQGSSSWGWTDPESGREFIATGMYEGTGLLEISKEGQIVKLGFLPSFAPTGRNSLWHEIRAYKNYMLIGSELAGHGIQIFDMKKLLAIDPASPVTFTNVIGAADGLTSHVDWLPTGRSHTVTVNEEKGYAVANGAAPRTDVCASGLIFIDLTDPSNPKDLGCNAQDGYVHDSQCIVYRGPDVKYNGRDICYGYNEDTLTIYDVTDKNASQIISITSYTGASYTHQGWVIDPLNQHYLLLDDEVDEEDSAGPAADGYPVTYIWDISSLAAPKQTGIYKAANRGIDHNQYVHDGLSYQSSYGAGLRIYDISSIPTNPTGTSVCEIAYFDIYPEDDAEVGGGLVEYSGTWSSYGSFKSGFIFINTMERGAYVVKMNRRDKCAAKTCAADNCLRALRSTSVDGRLQESQAFCGEFTDGWKADVKLVPEFATTACEGNVIARVSSACACLPTPTAA